MSAAVEVVSTVGVSPVLSALGLSSSTFYRRRKPTAPRPARKRPARALAPAEQSLILGELHGSRFVDSSPAEVVATLLDEERYLCSERTMYRLLAAHKEVRERRNQLRHPEYKKPELLATGPNQVWSWDITKLKTHTKWVYLYLYVILDIFSRYVVGWTLAEKENGAIAERLVRETLDKHGIVPGQLILHADRGSPMKAKPLVHLLSTCDVLRSHSRPHVSDDNPFSESQFRTMKYHPTFPDRFGGQLDGFTFCRSFFPWYNHEHHHSGIAYLTPADVHYDRADEVLRRRHAAMMVAYAAHPERFVGQPPIAKLLPAAVYINPPRPAAQPEAGGKPAPLAGVPAGGPTDEHCGLLAGRGSSERELQ